MSASSPSPPNPNPPPPLGGAFRHASLKRLLARFGTLEALAREIRRIPEFASTNRSTIQRWVNLEAKFEESEDRPNDARTVAAYERAKRVAKILSGAQRLLRVAYHPAFLYLPIMISNSRRKRADATFFQQRGLEIQQIEINSGGEALKLLRSSSPADRIDVAFCYRNLPQRDDYEAGCMRLTSFCKYEFGGLYKSGIRPPRSRSDLRQLRYAYPDRSGIPGFLSNHLRNLVHDLREFDSVSEAADLLTENVNCILWWQPHLDQVAHQALAKGVPTTSLPRGTLPRINIDMFINKNDLPRTASALMSFLETLYEFTDAPDSAITEVEPSALQNIGRDLGLEGQTDLAKTLEKILPDYDFHVDEISLPSLFAAIQLIQIGAEP